MKLEPRCTCKWFLLLLPWLTLEDVCMCVVHVWSKKMCGHMCDEQKMSRIFNKIGSYRVFLILFQVFKFIHWLSDVVLCQWHPLPLSAVVCEPLALFSWPSSDWYWVYCVFIACNRCWGWASQLYFASLQVTSSTWYLQMYSDLMRWAQLGM